jgi:hypothetical protein
MRLREKFLSLWASENGVDEVTSLCLNKLNPEILLANNIISLSA